MFEDVGGDVSIGDEREHAQGIAAARTLGDLVAENPAQQSKITPNRAKSTRVFAKLNGKWMMVHANFAADPLPK